ncbi:MAG: DUF2784 domain-containing protein [Candidatus Aminicenantes bacterium]|nr:DUF2784 domain-containing protein [Candidatus Aminicenantes bacterium]
MDGFLDKFFFVFHSSWIVFLLFGWIWKRTRRANLAVILLTAFSWFVLGIWYGYGYCPSTDWHWQARARLGYQDLPNSYTKFLVDSLTGWNVSQSLIDVLTLVLLVAAFGASLYVNLKPRRKRASERQNDKSATSP